MCNIESFEESLQSAVTRQREQLILYHRGSNNMQHFSAHKECARLECAVVYPFIQIYIKMKAQFCFITLFA